MDLQIANPYAFELPGTIGESTLTLAEIGAIAVVMCLKAGRQTDALFERIASPEMSEPMESLRTKGVLNPGFENDGETVTLSIDIDLTGVLPDE